MVFIQVLLLSLIVASPAFATNTLPYGSRCGQENEIVSRSGLNTKKAVIKTRPSKSLAREFCTCYMGDKSKKCIRELMASLARATTIVKANCKKLEFTTLYEANWLIHYVDGKFIDVAKGEEVETTSGGQSVMSDTLEALCPAIKVKLKLP